MMFYLIPQTGLACRGPRGFQGLVYPGALPGRCVRRIPSWPPVASRGLPSWPPAALVLVALALAALAALALAALAACALLKKDLFGV